MGRRKVRAAGQPLPFELPLAEPAVEGTAALVPQPAALPVSASSTSDLLPLTKAQVHYWRELCGALTLAGRAGLSSADDFPPALCPSRTTLTAMVERGMLVRRQRAWHLTRHWYARLTELRLAAVDTPQLRVSERPAPGMPSYAELKAWETLCGWLDTQPRQRARLPFTELVVVVTTEAEEAEALPALVESPAVPMVLLRGMRRARIVRHTSACEWVLAHRWRERLQALWLGLDCAQREMPPGHGDTPGAQARSLVAGIDTWVLNWRVEEALPARLRQALDEYQAQAREEETELDTRWGFDGVPLREYRWGTQPEHSGGVSWSYVLLNPSLRLVIRKAPLGGIIAQARLGAEGLWRLGARRALDELDALMRRMWGGAKGQWQVSQVHLAHDVVNAPLRDDWRDRFVSRSRSQAQYEASQQQLDALARLLNGAGDDAVWPIAVDWEAQYAAAAAADADPGWDPFVLPERETPEDEDPFDEEADDRAVTQYATGRRLSGFTWSPGGAISVVLYRKDWEQAHRGRAYMEPLWRAAGWQRGEPVTRCEARLRREAIRALRLPQQPQAPVLDDPWAMLEHLNAIFATVLGQTEEACPDATNVAWLRLVVPDENERNRARWETDPIWRVIQAAPFTRGPAAARRLIRRTERTRCAQQLDHILYGVLALRVQLGYPPGEHWDISRAVGDVVPALTQLASRPDKDFGERVRTRRQELGLPVVRAQHVLPVQASQPMVESPEELRALDAEPPEVEEKRAAWRVRLAERRMREAYVVVEEAEQRGAAGQEVEQLVGAFLQERAAYDAAMAAVRRRRASSGQRGETP